LLRSKLLFSGVVLFVLLCFSLVSSAKAASMWSRAYGWTGDDLAFRLLRRLMEDTQWLRPLILLSVLAVAIFG
jgi:hypothetical protein